MRILDIGPWIAYPPQRGRAVRAYNLLRRLAVRHDVRQWGRGQVQLRRRPGARLLEEVPVTPMFRVYRSRYPLARTARDWLLARQPDRGAVRSVARGLACPPRLRELLDWASVILAEDPVELALCRREQPDGRFAFVAHDVGATDGVSVSGHDLVGDAVSAAELVVALSASDRQELLARYSLDPAAVVEVPNGADVERYRPVDDPQRAALRAELGLPAGRIAVFAGSASPANRVALGWLRRLAAASDRHVFVAAGSVGAPERSGRLVVTGEVPDVAPYLQAADVALCPIEHGSGTRIKLFESLACGLPTVAFAESVRGIDIDPGVHAVVCEKSERALLDALDGLARDSGRAAELGRNGRAFVVARHSWDDLAERLDGALRARFDPEFGHNARHTYAPTAVRS
jgi:glycosyltransferase involved in cell wall biosynthesis